jgi:hypothetical protein
MLVPEQGPKFDINPRDSPKSGHHLGAAVQDMMADLALMGTEAVGLGIAA